MTPAPSAGHVPRDRGLQKGAPVDRPPDGGPPDGGTSDDGTSDGTASGARAVADGAPRDRASNDHAHDSGAPALDEPPRLRPADHDRTRSSTWLEQFYDLIFSLAIAEAGEYLAAHIGLTGLLRTGAVFLPVWLTWAGHTVYATRFDTDDVVHRLLTLLQMVAAVVMAVAAQRAEDGGAGGGAPRPLVFGGAFVVARVALVLLYLRADRAVPKARAATRSYLAWYGTSTVLWTTGLAAGASWMANGRGAWLWGALCVLEMVGPVVVSRHIRHVPIDASHLPERVGSFFLIVLYVSVWAVVDGVVEVRFTPARNVVAVAGFVLASGVWWLYFATLDGVSDKLRERHEERAAFYMSVHLPLFVAALTAGVGMRRAIIGNPTGPLPPLVAALLFGGIAVWLGTFVLVRKWLTRAVHRMPFVPFVGAAVIAVTGVVATRLPNVATLPVAATVMVAIVAWHTRLLAPDGPTGGHPESPARGDGR